MLTLKRKYYTDRTEGLLYNANHELKTLELKWNNNKQNVSCIPEGIYKVVRDYSGKHQYYRVTGVCERTFIEFHVATKTSDLLGCIGLQSKADCQKLIDWYGDDGFMLEIYS